MLTLGIRKIEKFVNVQKSLGNDIRWDGWDIVFFRPSPKGRFDKNGAFRNGTWGFDNRVGPNDKGVWEIDFRNVKKVKDYRRSERTRV